MSKLLTFHMFLYVFGPYILGFELFRIVSTKVCGAKCYVFGGNRIVTMTPEGVHHLWSTDVAWLQRGGKGGRHNNVTQLQYVAIMQLLDTQDTLH